MPHEVLWAQSGRLIPHPAVPVCPAHPCAQMLDTRIFAAQQAAGVLEPDTMPVLADCLSRFHLVRGCAGRGSRPISSSTCHHDGALPQHATTAAAACSLSPRNRAARESYSPP